MSPVAAHTTRRRPAPARWVALVAALLLGLGGVVAGTPSATAAETVGTGVTELSSCLTDGRVADVLVLVDQSGSLRRSDPADQRVGAVKLLLDGLAQRAAAVGARVETRIAGFDADVTALTPWTALDAAALPGLSAAVDGFAQRDTGVDTDYWTALDSAHRILLEKASPTPPCRALFLVTDGEYSIEPRDGTKRIPGTEEDVALVDPAAAQRVVDAGIKDLCRPGGLADRLRVDDVVLFAVGLDGATSPDFSLIRRVATAQDCGAQPPTGAFVSASSPLDLLFVVDSPTPPGPPRPVCERDECPPGAAHEFTLDPSLREIELTAVSDRPGLDVEVRAPGVAEPAVFTYDAGSPTTDQTLGDVRLSGRWPVDNALRIRADIPESGRNWSGLWTVTFVDRNGTSDAQESRTRLELRSGLGVDLGEDAPAPWRAGDEITVPLRLVRPDGSDATLSQPPPVLDLNVELVPEQAGRSISVASGLDAQDIERGLTYSVPADVPQGKAQLRTTLEVTSAGGQRLEPSVRATTVDLAAPAGYPTVLTTAVDLGQATGTDSSAGEILVAGPGCVWLEGGGALVAPADINAMTVESDAGSEQDCQRLAAGEQRRVEFRAAPLAAANGPVTGRVIAHLVPEAADAPDRTAEVEYSLALQRERAPGALLALLTIAALAGLGLPLGLYALARWWEARFPAENESLQAAVLPVSVSHEGVLSGGELVRGTEGQHLAFLPPPANGRKRQPVGPLTLAARPSWSPTEPGYVDVVGEDLVGMASSGRGFAPKTGRLRASLALQNAWLLVARRDDVQRGVPFPAQLVVVVNPQGRREKAAELMGGLHASVRSRLGTFLEAVGGPAAAREPAAAGTAAGTAGPAADPGGAGRAEPDPWDDWPADEPAAGEGRAHDPGTPGEPGWGPEPAAGEPEPDGDGWDAAPAGDGGWDAVPTDGGWDASPAGGGWDATPAGDGRWDDGAGDRGWSPDSDRDPGDTRGGSRRVPPAGPADDAW